MVTVKLIGGLGNQMFQVATAYAAARDNNMELILTPHGWDALSGLHPDNYRTNIFGKFKWTDDNLPFSIYRETTEYKKLAFKHSVKLMGYFQNPKYFDTYRNDLKTLFLDTGEIMEGCCALHVRRGDYLRISKYHVITKEYIDAAIKKIDKEMSIKKILLFSNDMDWCKKNISDSRIVESDKSDVENINLMSRCEANIISNSSYSWWGAYLGQGKVIAPDIWYNGMKTNLAIFETV